MKKILFILLAVCSVCLCACDDNDDYGSKKITPVLTPNNTDLTFSADGGQQTLTVSNARELNIVQINDKTTDSNGSAKETDVRRYDNGKLKDLKNVTEGGWFTARIVQDNGIYRTMVITVSKNTDKNARTKYLHLTCGENMYGISMRIIQQAPEGDSDK